MENRTWPGAWRLRQLAAWPGPDWPIPQAWVPAVEMTGYLGVPRQCVRETVRRIDTAVWEAVPGSRNPAAELAGMPTTDWQLAADPPGRVSATALGHLLALGGVDRAGLEQALDGYGRPGLAERVRGARRQDLARLSERIEIGDADPTHAWIRDVAKSVYVSENTVKASWGISLLSWAAGATPHCGLSQSRQALAARNAHLLLKRQAVTQASGGQADLLVAAPAATAADLTHAAAGGIDPDRLSLWVPASGLLQTPDHRARLGVLDLECLLEEPTVDDTVWWSRTAAVGVRVVDLVGPGRNVAVCHQPARHLRVIYTVVASLSSDEAAVYRLAADRAGRDVTGRLWPATPGPSGDAGGA